MENFFLIVLLIIMGIVYVFPDFSNCKKYGEINKPNNKSNIYP